MAKGHGSITESKGLKFFSHLEKVLLNFSASEDSIHQGLNRKPQEPISNTGKEQKKMRKNFKIVQNQNFVKAIDQMAEKWTSTFVARKSVGEFTGGLLSPKTMANEDCLGTGVEDRFYMMNQVCYPVDSLITWLKNRVTDKWNGHSMA